MRTKLDRVLFLVGVGLLVIAMGASIAVIGWGLLRLISSLFA